MSKAHTLVKDWVVYKTTTTSYGAYITNDIKTIPKGTFLRPFWNRAFVPKNVLDEWAGDEDCTYCYTYMGIYPIPTKLIEEV